MSHILTHKQMNTTELAAILGTHAAWLRDEPDGKQADLRRADLRGANLSWANLIGADLRGADLRGADLAWADLIGADLIGADLRGADLRGADLRGADLAWADLRRADLRGADLRGADLRATCLDPAQTARSRAFARASRQRGIVVYRTAQSLHIGDTQYEPGRTYVAGALSWDTTSDCHPGIYAGTLAAIRDYAPGARLVRCYVRAGEYVVTGKGLIRCARLRVLGYVEEAD